MPNFIVYGVIITYTDLQQMKEEGVMFLFFKESLIH